MQRSGDKGKIYIDRSTEQLLNYYLKKTLLKRKNLSNQCKRKEHNFCDCDRDLTFCPI